eukprot:scaffold9110_cov52-Phaeocystis_antarctica.AAC.4
MRDNDEVLQQAQAEGLVLVGADSRAGFFGVYLTKPGQPKPYKAGVWSGGKNVHLGCFATAEEAALCVARSPEAQVGAKRAATERAAAERAAPPLTSEQARQQAHAERLTLLKANNKTGFSGVYPNSARFKPFDARVKRDGKLVHLGRFVTAEEAALCVARSPEGQAAAARAAAAAPLTSEEVQRQVQAEGLTLRVANNKTGYFGVGFANPGHPRPYKAQVRRGGKLACLGSFATAEEAALSVARSPEAQVAIEKAAAAPPLTGDDDGSDDAGEEGEEEIQVLDAVEVLVASDDDDEEEALAMHAEEVTLVVERKRARESTR